MSRRILKTKLVKAEVDVSSEYEAGTFSFTWKIQNFKYCMQRTGEFLPSPRFKLDLKDTTEWYLSIYERIHEKQSCMAVGLHVHSSGPFPVKVKRYLSFLTPNGRYRKIGDESVAVFEKQGGIRIQYFLKRDFFKAGDDSFLVNDTLTLCCQMQKEPPEVPVIGRCFAQTVIDAKQVSFLWTLENFKEFLRNGKDTVNFNIDLFKTQSFTVSIFLSGGIYNTKSILVGVETNNRERVNFLTCKLSLLDTEGKTAFTVCDDHLFDGSRETESWCFTFVSLKKVLENEEQYLVKGALSLHWKFSVFSGKRSGEIKRIEYGEAKDEAVNTTSSGSLIDNLQRFYKEGKFTDFTLRTASSKEFPVHKAILCARSEVFSAMFGHATKENQTGVVEIEDLSDNTVSMMLQFIYTDIVEDLQWETALDLYFAADKYEIIALKRACTTFLMNNMRKSNICELVVFADLHQDQLLKAAAHAFIIKQSPEIVNTSQWRKFKKEKPNLAVETMQEIFVKIFTS